MKIGIDLDGTAWRYQEFFKEFIKAMKLRGHTVGIVTAHRGIKQEDLNLWSRRGFPNPDFYISKDEFPERLGEQTRFWKLRVCNINGIEYLFDDFDDGDVKFVGTLYEL